MATTKATPEVPETDQLVPPAQEVYYTFGPEGLMTFRQRPLSFFGKMELFGIMGSAVDKALADGLSLGEILDEVPTSADDFGEANQFIRSIAKIVQYAPDFLKDLYVISLGVPKGQRDYVKSVMEQPEDEGGLTDDQGILILDTFIDQNWEVLLDFFKEKVLPLISKVTSGLGSQSSKP